MEKTVGYGFGNMYRYRTYSLSVVVVALTRSDAIVAVAGFLADRGFETHRQTIGLSLKPTRQIGSNSTLIIAVPSYQD